VADISKVHLRFWSHEHWNLGTGEMHWAYVELRPVLTRPQQHAQQHRQQQWQQWWQQRRPYSDGSSSSTANRGDGGGWVTRVRRLLGLRRGFLE
jgi:hypothetical protein